MYLFIIVQLFECFLFGVHSCPSFCVCIFRTNGTGETSLVQCSDPGILSIPTNAPSDTIKLRLEKTSISRVPRAAFYNLSELQFLWLTGNTITSIHHSSFLNLKALRELRMDGNLLSAFPWEGLRDMPRLRTLGLHNNRIASLPAYAALFLPNITYLDLSSNRLTILPAELLNLWFPFPGQQGSLVQRRVLGLHDNPWLCNCQISMVKSLSLSVASPVVLVDQWLMCSRSLGQPGVLLTQMDLPQCTRPSVQPAATSVVSPLGSNVILRCDATGYPTPTLSWIKASSYTDCCRRGYTSGNSELLPRNVESFIQESPQEGVRWSIISLNGLSYKDAGEYRCLARNMAGMAEAPIRLEVVRFVGAPRSLKYMKSQPKMSSENKKQQPLQRARRIPATSTSKKNQLLENIKPPTPINKAVKPPFMSKVFPQTSPSKHAK